MNAAVPIFHSNLGLIISELPGLFIQQQSGDQKARDPRSLHVAPVPGEQVLGQGRSGTYPVCLLPPPHTHNVTTWGETCLVGSRWRSPRTCLVGPRAVPTELVQGDETHPVGPVPVPNTHLLCQHTHADTKHTIMVTAVQYARVHKLESARIQCVTSRVQIRGALFIVSLVPG